MFSIQTHGRVGLHLRLWSFAGSTCLVLTAPVSALAQGFGPDPFKPFNSQYQSYVYPIAPGPLDPVGNPSLNRAGVRGANRFEEYLSGVGAPSNRYDQLYRSQISSQRRSFRPATEADARFEDQQNELTTLYFKYIRERDPVKRPALLKAYNKARTNSAREVPAAARAANGRKSKKPQAGAEAAEKDAMEDEADDSAVERVVSPPRRGAGTPAAAPRTRPRATVPPPPPPITGGADSRTSPRPRDRTPSNVLDRAVEGDRGGRRSGTPPPPPPITP